MFHPWKVNVKSKVQCKQQVINYINLETNFTACVCVWRKKLVDVSLSLSGECVKVNEWENRNFSIYTIDPNLHSDGVAVVRCSNSPLYQSCQFAKTGIRVCSARREATIPRCQRAEGYSHPDILDDWPICSSNSTVEENSNAGVVWSFSLHGCFVSERSSVLRQNTHNLHAR